MTRLTRYHLIIVLLAGACFIWGCARTERTETRRRTACEVLDNGLTLVAEESPGSGLASVVVYVGDGGLYEAAENAGTAYLLSLAVFQKTDSRAYGELPLEIVNIGGTISRRVEFDYTAYLFSSPAERFDDLLALVAEGLLHSVIDDEVIERERALAASRAANPWERQIDRAYQSALALYFGDHPYGRSSLGDPDVISSIGIDDLAEHHGRVYAASNMLVSVAGDIDVSEVLETLAVLFEDAEPGEPATPVAEPVLEPVGTSTVLRGEGPAASLVLAFPAPGAHDTHDVAMDVLLVAAGGPSDSRLSRALSGKAGLVTGIDAGWYTRKQPSPFIVWVTLPPANLEAAEAGVVDVLRKMAEEPLAEEDLSRSKDVIELNYALDRERSITMAMTNAYWVWVAGETFWREYHSRIRSVTSEEVRAAAEAYFASGRHTSAAVLPE